MKKKIIIVLSVFSLLLLLGGIYLIEAIGANISRFDRLILLHQVEILREHLLLNIRTVQADLYLHDTRHAQSDETIENHVRTMRSTIGMCFGCHHAENVRERIQDLSVRIDQYARAVNNVLARPSGTSRFRAEKDATYEIGDELTKRVNTMIALTNRKLSERTQAAQVDARQMRTLLTALIALGPLLSIGLAYRGRQCDQACILVAGAQQAEPVPLRRNEWAIREHSRRRWTVCADHSAPL